MRLCQSFRTKGGKKKKQCHENIRSGVSPNLESPHPMKQFDHTQAAYGHKIIPQDHHSNQQPNSRQMRTSAPLQERSSETHDHASPATRTSGYEDKGHEGEGKEMRPALEELQQAFEHFKMGQYSRSNISGVIQYVHALQAENSKVNRSRDKAQTALESLGHAAMELIWNLHPNVMEEMTRNDQFTAIGALNFLLEDYKSLWETNDSNCNKMSTMNRQIGQLRQDMSDQNIQHRQQVDQIKGHLDNEKRRHNDEEERMRALSRSKLHELEEKHKQEITVMKGEHKHSMDSLTTDHQKKLTDLKAKLEGDIKTLQEALLSVMERFQTTSDSDLRLRFDGLRASVVRVARSPFNVDAEALGARLNQATFIQLAPPRHHKFALESSIWAILMDGIFASPFKIFDDSSGNFSTLWSQIVQEDHRSINPDFEKWRCVTFKSLRRAATENTAKRPAEEMIRKNYESNVAKIFRSLSTMVSQVSSQDRQADIRSIIDTACSLAFDFGEQRCRLELFAPGLNHKVSRQNVKTYRDMNGDNNPSLEEGIVQLVVSPGLRRTGGGYGSSPTLDEVLDLYPAAVYLVEAR